MDSVSVVIAAAGCGSRMGLEGRKNKQFIKLRGVPLIGRTLRVFEDMPQIGRIVIAARPEDTEPMRELLREYGFSKVSAVIAGGETRQRSVSLALEELRGEENDIVLIHDGARPFIKPERIEELIDAIQGGECSAAAVGVPQKDTVKRIDEAGFVAETPDRSRLISIQTPQAFRYGLIVRAHREAESRGTDLTDDCAAVEMFTDAPVKVVIGDYTNIKITTPEDLLMGEMILKNGER